VAHGDVIDRKIPSSVRYKFLDGATGTDDGQWVDSGEFAMGSFDLQPGTGTLQLRGSDDPTQPDNTDHGFSIASTTARAQVQVPILPKWTKVYCSAHTGGTHNAYGRLMK